MILWREDAERRINPSFCVVCVSCAATGMFDEGSNTDATWAQTHMWTAPYGVFAPTPGPDAVVEEFLPLGDCSRRWRRPAGRTLRVGARLEQQARHRAICCRRRTKREQSHCPSTAVTVRSVRSYQVRLVELMLAQVSNDDGKQVVFSRYACGRLIGNGTSCAACCMGLD